MGSLFDDDGDDYEDLDTTADMAADDVESSAPPEAEELTPRTNPDFFGHQEVEQSLLRDVTSGRLPHAIILAGPPGIGKATFAYRLARFLFTQETQEAGLFGEVPAPANMFVSPANPVFRRVAASGHADLLTVEREFDEKKGRYKNDISVDSVRRIHPFLRKTAAEGGWRVVIVDGAECLNGSSQNALLKVVEEPPARALLILTTSQPGAFLPTIRSRCRMVHMGKLDDKAVGNLLDRMAPALKPDEKATLIRLAEGSIGRAMQFHDDDGVALYKQLLDIVSTVPELDMVKVHDIADKIGRSGAEQTYATAMDILTGWCSRATRAAARGQPLTDVVAGDAAVFTRIAQNYPPNHFLTAWEKISELTRQTDIYNLDRRQALIGAFLALQRPDYQGLGL